MAYIANKPVRFDRNYRIGEVIPSEVIEPKMIRKLMDMGRIIHVDLPGAGSDCTPVELVCSDESADETSEQPQGSEQNAPNDEESTEGTNIPDSKETEQDGQNMPSVQQCESEDDAEFMNPPESEPDDGELSEQPQESEQNAVEKDAEFVCSVCGKKFASKNALSAHSRSHKG